MWMNLGVDRFKQMTPERFQPGLGLRPGGERPDLEHLVVAAYRGMYDAIATHSRLGFNVVVDAVHHDVTHAASRPRYPNTTAEPSPRSIPPSDIVSPTAGKPLWAFAELEWLTAAMYGSAPPIDKPNRSTSVRMSPLVACASSRMRSWRMICGDMPSWRRSRRARLGRGMTSCGCG